MSVREAVEKIAQSFDRDVEMWGRTTLRPDRKWHAEAAKSLRELLASHEALLRAGEALLGAPRPMVTNRPFVAACEALAQAVKEATQ